MENDGGEQQKVDNFYEDVVPQLTDQHFKEQFRLSRQTVTSVLEKMEAEGDGHDGGDGEPRVTMEKKLLLFLWYLGRQHSQPPQNSHAFRAVTRRCVRRT